MISWSIIALIALIIGSVGTLIPFIPGIPIMFIVLLIYGYAEDFQRINTYFLVITGIITIASTFVDNIAAIIGAKKYGASKLGILASFLGGLFGVIILGPLGIILGPLFSVIIVEIFMGKDFSTSIKIGLGTLLGIAGGTFIKFILALFIVIWFGWRVFF